MIKVFVFLKRRKGYSMEQLIDWYENEHAPLAYKQLPNLKKYVRHYLYQFGNSQYGVDAEQAYDIVTEIWFENKVEFDKAMVKLDNPEIQNAIREGDPGLFERSTIRYHVVEDYETEITG